MRRFVALFLCVAVLLAVIAGCSSDELGDDAGDTPDTVDFLMPADLHEACTVFCFDRAFNAFPVDTVMITVEGGLTVSWQELYYSIFRTINNLLLSEGEISAWSDFAFDEVTYQESALGFATGTILMLKATEYGAIQYGVSMSAEDYERFQGEFDIYAMMYDSAEEFVQVLWSADGIRSRRFFNYLIATDYLRSLVFGKMFGENGELAPDDLLEAHALEEGYMMARHIPFARNGFDDEASLAEAQDVLRQLYEYNGDDFDGFFEELIFEFTEERGGVDSFIPKYLFKYGDMIPEFSAAVAALSVGELSGVVETGIAYYIIQRLPIDYNEIPMGFIEDEVYIPLRLFVSRSLFDLAMYEWRDSLNPVFSAEYESMDFSEMFRPCT